MSGFMKNVQWYSFRNDSGETIPAHAFIRADNGDKDSDGKVWISAKQPNASGLGSTIYVNGPVAVNDGQFGLCTNSQIVAIAYDGALSPAAGDVIGPKSGEWLGFKNEPGATILSLNDESHELPLAWIVRKSSGCSAANAIFGMTLIGPPTGGTFSFESWLINGSTDTVSGLAYNISAGSLQTALEAHSGVGSGNVSVTGGNGNVANFMIEFQGDLANLPVVNPVMKFSTLTGTAGIGALAWPVQIGRAA